MNRPSSPVGSSPVRLFGLSMEGLNASAERYSLVLPLGDQRLLKGVAEAFIVRNRYPKMLSSLAAPLGNENLSSQNHREILAGRPALRLVRPFNLLRNGSPSSVFKGTIGI